MRTAELHVLLVALPVHVKLIVCGLATPLLVPVIVAFPLWFMARLALVVPLLIWPGSARLRLVAPDVNVPPVWLPATPPMSTAPLPLCPVAVQLRFRSPFRLVVTVS